MSELPKISDEQVERIISMLQGTCDDLNYAIVEVTLDDEADDTWLTEDQHQQIDQEIFKCETCGWWYEICESGDCEGNCSECSEDIIDEEQ